MRQGFFARNLAPALSLFCLVACAGGRGAIGFDSLQYPASMSGYLYNSEGHALPPESFVIADHFSKQLKIWGLAYSWAPVTKGSDTDVSGVLNAAIKKARGDGVIYLTVTSTRCWMNNVPIVTLLPFWPGCANVTVEGEIVRRKAAKTGDAGGAPACEGPGRTCVSFLAPDEIAPALRTKMEKALSSRGAPPAPQ